MASADTYNGLSAGFGLLGNFFTKQSDRKQDERAERRKQEMAMQLQEQLMQRKLEFAKANPSYGKFIQSPFDGGVTGIDEFGGTKAIMPGDPRVEAANKAAAEMAHRKDIAGIEKDEAYTAGQGLLIPARAEQARAAAAVSRARAASLKNPQTKAEGKSKSMTPSQLLDYKKKLRDDITAEHPEWAPTASYPGGPMKGGDPEAFAEELERRLAELTAGRPAAASNPYMD